MRLLCLIFFSFLNISFPQEISSLYKDYLSPEIKNNKIYLSQISSGFDELIKINPELIYYSIKYFNAMADTTSDRFFLTNFIKIRNMYQAGYIKWIRDVEDRIEQAESNSELKRISVNFLDDCLYKAKNDSVPGLSYKTDFNFMNFLIVKYYLQDTALRYNCSEDY